MTSQLLSKQIIEKLPQYEREFSSDKVSELIRSLTSNEFRVSHMLETIPKTASLVASMHWTLLDFEGQLLATGDQPVTAVPLLGDNDRAEVAPMPSTGYVATTELRIALSPSRALLLTWMNDEDPERPLQCHDAVAVELNRAVVAQADREWFHHPEPAPGTDYRRRLRPRKLSRDQSRADPRLQRRSSGGMPAARLIRASCWRG